MSSAANEESPMTEVLGPIIGIDLGTTNSVVSVIRNGFPEVIKEDGEAILPSVVGLDAAGHLLIGQAAKNQLVAFPERTLASVKRHMGTIESLALGEQKFTPPEISAMILRRLRDRASAALGTDVKRAVITVPAFFDENQRQATREAGRLAGLHVERIINEPTAATLVYRANSKSRSHLLVYDFGGGTFDVSVVRMESGVIEVLCSKGDTRLGGDDLDHALLNFVADDFYNQHQIDLRKDSSSRWRLLQACETVKRKLSSDAEVRLAEEFIAEKDGKALNLDIKISREHFEGLISEFVQRTIHCVDDAIRDAGLTLQQIDDLVLVGGSTRIPFVEQRLRSEFRLEPSHSVDPDLAVALGAAIQAAMIAGEKVGQILIDVTTHTLGIEVLEMDPRRGPLIAYSPIIHRNTPLPISHEKAYYAVEENQKSARIKIFQGESQQLGNNREIGSIQLNLDNPSLGRDKVIVRFDLSLDGTLKVTATQLSTGFKESLIINNALSHFQEEQSGAASDRLDSMFENAPKSGTIQRFDDAESELAIESHLPTPVAGLPGEIQAELADSIATLNSAKLSLKKLSGEDAEELGELIEKLENALVDQNRDSIKELCTEIDDVLFYAES